MDFGKLISGYDPRDKTIIFGNGKRRICYGNISHVAHGTYGTYLSIRHGHVLKSANMSRQLPTVTIFVTNNSHVTDDGMTDKIVSYGHGAHPKTIILTSTTDPSQIQELAKNLLC